jgi:hypothetical protein
MPIARPIPGQMELGLLASNQANVENRPAPIPPTTLSVRGSRMPLPFFVQHVTGDQRDPRGTRS